MRKQRQHCEEGYHLPAQEPIDTAFIRFHLARFVDDRACCRGLETPVGTKALPKRGQEDFEQAKTTSQGKRALIQSVTRNDGTTTQEDASLRARSSGQPVCRTAAR